MWLLPSPIRLSLIVLTLLIAPARAQVEDDQIGRQILIEPDKLAPPRASPSVSNSPRTVTRPPGAGLNVPPGFRAQLFAERLSHARYLAVAPNGDVLLAESRAGKITLLRDADGDGVAEQRTTFAENLDTPHGLALRDGYVYIGELTQVRRLPYRVGATEAGSGVPAGRW